MRAVAVSQMLFTTGHVLTTGGFLYYYADAFGPSAFQFSFLLILPELAESAGFLSRPLSRLFGSRKRTWMACLLGARLFALGVPLMAAPVLISDNAWPFETLAMWVAGWYVLQGIAYACFISWLSDLVPQTSWGKLFARRKMAMLGIMLVVPVATGLLRREWANQLPEQQQLLTYVSIFLLGNVLVMASVLPMRRLPERAAGHGSDANTDGNTDTGSDVTTDASTGAPERSARRTAKIVWEAVTHRSFRWILLHGWWLSFAQGLTQAAFFRYQTRVLSLSVETYYVLNGLMLALQLPLTAWAGRLSDRGWDKPVLFGSVTAVSGALVFWLAATPERWWLLFGAYAVWGLFGFVNICGRNLMLKLAPRSDNMAHIFLFRQVGGVWAAVAGMLGGLWLDRLTNAGTTLAIGEYALGAFQIVFLASFVGRLTAGLWVLPIRLPDDRQND